MPTPQQIVTTIEKSFAPSAPVNKAFQRRSSLSNRNASGQKKKTLCGNATRW